ncbi:5-formyltetrahydrofolate cyclo-ligase [Helicobacter gastrocanis]|uniref:5-formyltetrahydrofolate cyclo-ligase n=1 Tax=Helicobacter gastrocanis TaxID=2849641 RepID=UPI001C85CBEB|nr:5-formyltetrahydrofolate cyclo-ligase [Helicobacter sp. NHP19-003]
MLQKWVRPKAGLSVLVYCPLAHEADIRPFIRWARRRKMRLFAPLMHPPCCSYAPYRLPLSTKQHIKQPRPSNFKTSLDLAIVPILGVDRHFKRVGFGLGAYDRLFASLKHKPLLVFTARQILQSTHDLGAFHDIVGDICADHSGYFIQRKNYGRGTKHFDPLLIHRYRRVLLHQAQPPRR